MTLIKTETGTIRRKISNVIALGDGGYAGQIRDKDVDGLALYAHWTRTQAPALISADKYRQLLRG